MAGNQVLEWADRQQFDAIHIHTPGPVGLCGLAVAAMLRVPVVMTYHTDLPRYVSDLTGGDHRAVASLPPRRPGPGEDEITILRSLAAVWADGHDVDWHAVDQGRPVLRTPLPPYPYQRERFWADPIQRTMTSVPSSGDHEMKTILFLWLCQSSPCHASCPGSRRQLRTLCLPR